ncbi:MAG TPA: polyprenyl diphosphate synthase [Rhodocyclaceae bacterium]|nr:di-trans,poly-cis-decaprenylcistransferase [Rhodocyclaceae bacterium]HMV53037.1 polyprenyl diphosphate synthase [Rhodocyclaceae bacterium]HMZ83378.1 polyprenyl diphosphate synthase [Rhodocyclaceae bacterium]HNA03532.1 polyprenyl diphosphate synthase [Rhodocyclaceae bacterium]HNB78598.1 polyprenyl diphosphate synthase [Rhodocyclaceae bacterium]
MADTRFASSTREVPDSDSVPRHVAIIMDGNGRWARRRLLPRVAGHKRGVEAVRATIRRCIERGISYLTLFAFSSENWRRPEDEVSFLMQLFIRALEEEVAKLHENNIRFRVIGDLSRFDSRLVSLIDRAEKMTSSNDTLTLTIAANYGGRWDILQAVERMLADSPEKRQGFCEEDIARYLALDHAPEPDLFIRTGGEQRISNFLLWQLAYTELYFTDRLWPEFDAGALDEAIASYGRRERRFGRTSEQLASGGESDVATAR